MNFMPFVATGSCQNTKLPSSKPSAAGDTRGCATENEGTAISVKKITQKQHLVDGSLVNLSTTNKSQRKVCVPKTKANHSRNPNSKRGPTIQRGLRLLQNARGNPGRSKITGQMTILKDSVVLRARRARTTTSEELPRFRTSRRPSTVSEF